MRAALLDDELYDADDAGMDEPMPLTPIRLRPSGDPESHARELRTGRQWLAQLGLVHVVRGGTVYALSADESHDARLAARVALEQESEGEITEAMVVARASREFGVLVDAERMELVTRVMTPAVRQWVRTEQAEADRVLSARGYETAVRARQDLSEHEAA